jgi:MoaA/NifB/PqqE/SkfB family radical SAM enzyme
MNKYSYDFQGRLDKRFPSQVMVDITEVCNLACIHCTHPVFKESPVYKKRMLPPDLNKKMVDEVKQYGKNITKYIRYTSNGEPLVHPKSYEMILYAVTNSGTKVTLTTNGTLLKENRMQKLLDTGLHMIDVSIDAFTNNTYSKVRVNGDLNITKSNVLKLIDMKNKNSSNTKIIVSFVEQNENSKEIKEFKKYWEENGADQVLIRSLHTNSGSNLSGEDLSLANTNKKRRACLYPWERIILNAKGFLAFCPTDWYGKSELTDYRNSTIIETWTNKFYDELRKQHQNLKFSNNICKKCPDWENTSWPNDNNKSYADLVEKILYNDE